jgi:hypothetical protein
MYLPYALRLLCGASVCVTAWMVSTVVWAQQPPGMDNTLPEPVMTEPLAIPQAQDEFGEGQGQVVSSIQSEWRGSLMFDDKRAENLMALYRAYLIAQQRAAYPDAKSDEEIPLDVEMLLKNAENAGNGEEVPEEILNFSLNSILYDSPTEWSIWVNGRRYSRKAAMEGFTVGRSNLKVLKANRYQVTYVWTPIQASLKHTLGRWEEKQRLGDLVESPKVAKNQKVDFDLQNKNVTISMRPNQTFVSTFMSVMEGINRMPASAENGENEVNPNNGRAATSDNIPIPPSNRAFVPPSNPGIPEQPYPEPQQPLTPLQENIDAEQPISAQGYQQNNRRGVETSIETPTGSGMPNGDSSGLDSLIPMVLQAAP